MKKFAFLAISAAFVLASCSNDGKNSSEYGSTIEFRTVIDKTRASLIDSKDDLTSFFVHAHKGDDGDFTFLNAAVYYDGAGWTYSPKKYWPTDNSKVDFYAYAPIKDVNMSNFDYNGTTAEFDYVVPVGQNASNKAVDLLVASVEDKTAGTVALTFAHALSSVTFSAENRNNEDSELIYTISEIKIADLDNAGTYTYGTGWTPAGSNNQVYYAGLPESGVAVNPSAIDDVAQDKWVRLLSANDYMMVLPQDVQGKKVEITYSLKSGDGQYIYKDAVRELDFDTATFTKFVAGQRYNFKFAFTASDLIVFEVTDVTLWGDNNQEF